MIWCGQFPTTTMPSTKRGIDFQPDEEFQEQVNRPNRGTDLMMKTAGQGTEGKSALVPGVIEKYEELKRQEGKTGQIKVGHAGLYWEEDGSAHLTEKSGEDTLIETTMELGTSGKGQLLVMCEDGIANAVRELADDDSNHLPDSKTGVVIHYVTEGIARDFGITFDRQPVSLGGGRGRGASKNDRDAGKRGLSKADKNKLLAKLDMSYYQDDIASGTITIQDAFNSIQDALNQKMELEKMGYFLSPNKTEGVLLYDWKKEVNKNYASKMSGYDAVSCYLKNKVEVVVPNIIDNYFADGHQKANKTNTQHFMKSSLATCCIGDCKRFGVKGFDSGYLESDDDVSSVDDVLALLEHKEKGEVMGIHLAKLKKPGMMKPRYIVVDVLVEGKQVLYLYHQKSKLTLQE